MLFIFAVFRFSSLNKRFCLYKAYLISIRCFYLYISMLFIFYSLIYIRYFVYLFLKKRVRSVKLYFVYRIISALSEILTVVIGNKTEPDQTKVPHDRIRSHARLRPQELLGKSLYDLAHNILSLSLFSANTLQIFPFQFI